LAAGLERGSEHPLAEAILRFADTRHIEVPAAEDFHAVPGRGIRGRVAGHDVAVGTLAFLPTLMSLPDEITRRAEELAVDGQTVVLIAADGRFAGIITLDDNPRLSAREGVEALVREGITVVMLTGDRRSTAATVAKRLGISNVIAEVLPTD